MREALEKVDTRGGTALYDAVVASADHSRKTRKLEKRVLFVVTDGEDNESQESLEQAIRRLAGRKRADGVCDRIAGRRKGAAGAQGAAVHRGEDGRDCIFSQDARRGGRDQQARWRTTSAASTRSATSRPIRRARAGTGPSRWTRKPRATASSRYAPRAAITQGRNGHPTQPSKLVAARWPRGSVWRAAAVMVCLFVLFPFLFCLQEKAMTSSAARA